MGREFLRRLRATWSVLRTGAPPKVQISAFEWLDWENTLSAFVTVKSDDAIIGTAADDIYLKWDREARAERDRLFREKGIQPDWEKYWASAHPSDPRAERLYRHTKYPLSQTCYH